MRPADAAIAVGRIVSVLLRIEARRAVAWLSLAVTAGAVLGCRGAAAAPLAVAVGGLLAVAAIGHLPIDVRAGRPAVRSLVVVVRIQWPIVGAILAGTVLALRGGPAAAMPAAVVAGSLAATAASVVAFLRRDVAEGVAVSHSLACAGLGAAAGMAVVVAGGSGLAQLAATTAVSAALAGGLLTGQPPDRQTALGPPPPRHRRPLAGFGPAMASALVAMAGCYFLAPQFALGYALVAVGWFTAIAVPAATPAGDPPPAARLVRSACGRPAGLRSFSRSPGLVATTAGLLAWPAVVAAGLVGQRAWRPDGPLTALAAVAVIAGLTSVVGPITGAMIGPRAAGEVARAIVLSVVAAAAVGASMLGGQPA